jgi:hypothetical protein
MIDTLTNNENHENHDTLDTLTENENHENLDTLDYVFAPTKLFSHHAICHTAH